MPTQDNPSPAVKRLAAQLDQPAVPKLALTMQETADALGISYISVFRLLKRGLLRSSSALRHKVIPVTEVQRFLNATLE